MVREDGGNIAGEAEILVTRACCNGGKGTNTSTLNIADLARRRLSAQASSATSERAFSKAGLVISKKRQRLTADHVDGINLLGWHYKDNGWGELSKRLRCVPQVEETKT